MMHEASKKFNIFPDLIFSIRINVYGIKVLCGDTYPQDSPNKPHYLRPSYIHHPCKTNEPIF